MSFKEFEDFQRVQVDPHVDAGATPAEQIMQAVEHGPETVPGIQALDLSVGIGGEAKREFYLGIDEKVEGVVDIFPVDQVADYAAFVGLIVGLKARHLAGQRGGTDQPRRLT